MELLERRAWPRDRRVGSAPRHCRAGRHGGRRQWPGPPSRVSSGRCSSNCRWRKPSCRKRGLRGRSSFHGVSVFENMTIPGGLWLQRALIGASLAAAIMDVREGRIPNRLTLPLWLLGLAKATCLGGAGGVVAALGVSVLVALPYIVLFFLGKGGAGDAKLMAAIGALAVRGRGRTRALQRRRHRDGSGPSPDRGQWRTQEPTAGHVDVAVFVRRGLEQRRPRLGSSRAPTMRAGPRNRPAD